MTQGLRLVWNRFGFAQIVALAVLDCAFGQELHCFLVLNEFGDDFYTDIVCQFRQGGNKFPVGFVFDDLAQWGG